jgi:hypothetical protein
MFNASPDAVFKALQRAVVACGGVVQGADAQTRTVFFKRGRKNLSVTVGSGPDGVVLTGSDAGLHEFVARELETMPSEAAPGDVAGDLERLANLRERNLLTEDEFASAKLRALTQAGSATGAARPPVTSDVSARTPTPNPVATASKSAPPPTRADKRTSRWSALLARWHALSRRTQVVIAVVAVVLGITVISALGSSGGHGNPSTAAGPSTTTAASIPSTPRERVRQAVGGQVHAGGYAGDLQVKEVSFEGTAAHVIAKTPEGGFQGPSCGDLDTGTRAILEKIYNDGGWNGGAVVVYQGGLVNSATGAALPTATTGIYTMPAGQARQIDWSNSDALLNIDWSIYRDFCHPALGH